MGFLENSLGIFPEAINNAYDSCIDALQDVMLYDKANNFSDKARDCIAIIEVNWENATDHIIGCMFDTAAFMIKEAYPSIQVEETVNSYDSSITLKGPAYEFIIALSNATPHIYAETIKEFVTSGAADAIPCTPEELVGILDNISEPDDMISELSEAVRNGGDFTVYDSLEDLGESYLEKYQETELMDHAITDLGDDSGLYAYGKWFVEASSNCMTEEILLVAPSGVVLEINRPAPEIEPGER